MRDDEMANIKVAVRVRPISEREINLTGSEIVVHTEAKAISLTNLKVSSSKAGDSRERTRRYGFDYCFDSSDSRDEKYASQSKIYETLGESILDVLFRGYNSCLVAYGQSASGKTYTMMGSKEDPGLTPRVCEGLFLRLANEEKSNTNFDVLVSYLEVYNERVRDLLRPSSSSIGLKVREHPRLGPYVQGLTHHAVPTLGSLISRVEEGTRARKTASTLQNPTSSRSHALLTLSLVPSTSNNGQSAKDTAATPRNVSRRNDHFPRGSKLHLVDLAGSESAAACGGINRLKEGANINKSLVALGNVISALAGRGSTGSGPGRRFIPYRDSALTWLLKDALGGNATTIMLATISPASGSYNETSHTLRFAQRAQSVVNRPVINEDPVSRIIRELRAEVARLKSLLVEKNVNPDCKSICMCQRDREQETKSDNEIRVIDLNEAEEEKLDDEEEEKYEVSIETRKIPVRRHSTSESLLAGKKLSNPVRRFGSFEIVRESRNSSSKSHAAENHRRAEVTELIIDDEADEPVFVDIPTLVAVLIKPDGDIPAEVHRIEEISSDGTPEDVIDAEFSKIIEKRIVDCASNEFADSQSNEKSADDIGCSEISHELELSPENPVSFEKSTTERRSEGKLGENDSIDDDISPKLSSNLRSTKRYGSIEALPRKREIASALSRSQIYLENRNGAGGLLDKTKKLKNIRETQDQRSGKFANSWRNLSAWASRDYQRKGSNDSDKSLSETALSARSTRNLTRKQSIDGLKRKTSKDSSSSSSKDEISASGGVQTREIVSRKDSLENAEHSTRTHTPIQRARRAEIVAAVTERLYSSKKLIDDNASTAITASTPSSDILSPESTDVKLASATRMRLQEISRKMLAKRRRICVDTQTDNHHHRTVRMRDASSITEEPIIITKDASILTDRHENYETLDSIDCPVRRVKEMATWTGTDPQPTVIRCKDAANITENYYETYGGTINSPRNDSGIMSDDTQNYAESNLSSTEISDLGAIVGGRSVELVENSTSTRLPAGSPNSGSQTRAEDLGRSRCSNCAAVCCNGTRHCRDNYGHVNSINDQACHHTERSVISISMPEMMNITIETSNGVESKIRLFDGNESIDERSVVNLKDNVAQTENLDTLEIATTTDDIHGQACLDDFATSTKPMIAHTDTKTFRIENIFHETPGAMRNITTNETIGNSSNDEAMTTSSLIVTNSIGTSFVPETREIATGMETSGSYGSKMFCGATTRRPLTNDGFVKYTWPLRCQIRSTDSQWQSSRRDCSLLTGNERFSKDNSTNNSNSRYDMENTVCQRVEGKCTLGSDETIMDELDSREDPGEWIKLESTKTRRDDKPVVGLKSPSIVGMLDHEVCVEQDTNFSDDSLDLTEDAAGNDHENGKPVIESSKSKFELGEITTRETVCPPDLVAHTKSNGNDFTIPIENSHNEFQDFDDECRNIEFPKMKIDCTISSSFDAITPISGFKKMILGDPCCSVNHAENSDLRRYEDESSSETLFDDENYGCSIIDVVEDMKQCLVNGGHSVAPKSIIKKVPQCIKDSRLSGKYRSNCETRIPDKKISRTKTVRFAIPEVNCSTSSDSEACENFTSDDESTKQRPRKFFQEYPNEAIVFMRNMNSMNEYTSATCASDEFTNKARNRHSRGKAKSRNYIEYEGRRISLEDDTDKSVMSNENDDDDLEFNVESYDRCLRSMDRLEECVARIKRHDEALRDDYGIGRDESTGAKLDLANFSIDSNDSMRQHFDGDMFYDTCPTRNSGGNNVTASSDEIDDEKNKQQLRPKNDEDSEPVSVAISSEYLKKRRGRRFSRFSDLRKRNPTTYSQMRNRYASRAVDTRAMKRDEVSCSAVRIQSSIIDENEDTIVPDSLKIPDCYLILPKTTWNDQGPSEEFKSCSSPRRFSLSKYDSSNESSSSNEALASFMESIDNIARSRNKFRYPGSPRAKFLQLLSERRRIVENTRSTGASMRNFRQYENTLMK